MKTIVVDAYDSFVHIIYSYLKELDANPVVVRSNATSPEALAEERPDLVVLGPGPGHPGESGHVEIVRQLAGEVPLFGVCLGHQAIGMSFGASVSPAQHLMHGKTSLIEHDGQGCLVDQPRPFEATRYHSLIVEESTVPDGLIVTARSADDGYVMALRHETLPIESVQFHPESICTQLGISILQAFIRRHVSLRHS